METMFLDTNVVIRYLTNDDPAMAERSRALLKQAEDGKVVLVTSESVVVEMVQVLSSTKLYNLPRDQAANAISVVLQLKGVKIAPKQVYLRALDLWAASSADFVDALTVAHMGHQNIDVIASFDRDFDRFEGVSRREP